VGHPGSNKVHKFDCQDIQATIVRRATEQKFKSILFTLLNNDETKAIATEVFATKIPSESQKFAKMRNSFNTCDPILVSEFRNSRFAKELKKQTPFLHCAFGELSRMRWILIKLPWQALSVFPLTQSHPHFFFVKL